MVRKPFDEIILLFPCITSLGSKVQHSLEIDMCSCRLHIELQNCVHYFALLQGSRSNGEWQGWPCTLKLPLSREWRPKLCVEGERERWSKDVFKSLVSYVREKNALFRKIFWLKNLHPPLFPPSTFGGGSR